MAAHYLHFPTSPDPRLDRYQQSSPSPHANDADENGALYDSLSREVNASSAQDSSSFIGKFATQQQQQHDSQRHNSNDAFLESATSVTDERVASTSQQDALGAQQQHRRHILPRTADMDRQQRTAEEVVYLLNPKTVSVGQEARKRKRGSNSPQTQGNSPSISTNNLRFKNYGPPKRHKQDSEGSTVGASTLQLSIQEDTQTYATAVAAAAVATPTTDGEETFFVNEYPPNSTLTDARAAGVYSAAALFRKPSQKSKKYTRPPMSKLFSSLQLTPESFLRLQAASKTYMLNPAFPDRQSCVGNRGKGDTDMTKLRLYNCAKEFLEEGPDGGYGVTFFGAESEGRDNRNWEWPTHVNRVISLCTPLLRRMVTNERQRQYAIDQRKSEIAQTESPGGSVISKDGQGQDSAGTGDKAEEGGGDCAADDISSQVEHSLPTDISGFGGLYPATGDMSNNNDSGSSGEMGDNEKFEPPIFSNPLLLHPPTSNSPLHLHFCIVRSSTSNTAGNANMPQQQQRLIGLFDLPSNSCREFISLCKNIATTVTSSARLFESIDNTDEGGDGSGGSPEHSNTTGHHDIGSHSHNHVQSKMGSSSGWQHQWSVHAISALTPRGLVPVTDQESWMRVKGEVEASVWMEGLLKIVVEVVNGTGSRSGSGNGTSKEVEADADADAE